MFKKALCIILCFAVLILTTSCGTDKSYDLSDYSTATVLTDEEISSIKKTVLSIEFSKDLYLQSGVDYTLIPEETITLMSLGIRGVPIMLDTVQEVYGESADKDLSFTELFMIQLSHITLSGILRCGSIESCALLVDETHISVFGEHHSKPKAELSCFFLTAQSKILEILESDTDIPTKFPQLARFGILAIPYILPEIENGDTEYEDYFTYIGLHLTDKEFMDAYTGGRDVFAETYNWGKLQNDENYTKGSEDFDYKQWLDENADDIRALLKYIDEYTEEFKDLA